MEGEGSPARRNIPNLLLKRERERRGWTHKVVAEQINLPDYHTISRWERGVSFPSPHYRRELCHIFNMSMEELGLLPGERHELPPNGLNLQQNANFREVLEVFTHESSKGDLQDATAQPGMADQQDEVSSDHPEKVLAVMSALPPLSPVAFPPHFSRRATLNILAVIVASGGGLVALKVFHDSHSTKPITALAPVQAGTTLLIHHQGVNSVTVVGWSPDSINVASAGDDGSIQVWDADSGKIVTTYNGHAPGGANALAWSPDGKFIASAGGDKTVQIWEVATGTAIYIYTNHTMAVNTVAWSPNGSRIASGGGDKKVHVWDSFSGSDAVFYKGHTELIHGVSWSPDGQHIVSASNDKTLQVWDALTTKRLVTYTGHNNLVYGVAWAPGGIHIASVGGDGTVQVWDPVVGTTLLICRGHTSYTINVAWSPDSAQIASSSFDNTVRIWDAVTGKAVYIYRGHKSYVFGVDWSRNGKRIVSAGSYDRTVRVWEAP